MTTAVLLLLLIGCRSAHADATITLCGSDNQSGAGTNLDKALAIGGHITFSCGGPVIITVNCAHSLRANTDIDGGGSITLRGPMRAPDCSGDASAMFDNPSAQRFSLKLSRLRITDAKAVDIFHGSVTNGNLDLSLADIIIANSHSPILVDGQVHCERSQFTGNDGVVLETTEDIAITDHTRFIGNGGTPLQVFGGNVTIDGAEFADNKEPSFLGICVAADIRNSQFVRNSNRALIINCDTRIANSTFSNNQTKGDGGAIVISALAQHTKLVAVEFTGNIASRGGGAVSIRYGVGILNGVVPPPPVQLPPQSLELHHVTFKANHAHFAGALDARGPPPRVPLSDHTLTASEVQFIDNQADTFAGGLFVSRVQAHFSGAIFSGNRAASLGGAVVSMHGGEDFLVFGNSLLVKNTAPQGAAFAGTGTTFINTTIADNVGAAVFGIASSSVLPPIGGTLSPQPVQFSNTIVSGATSSACGPPDTAAPYINLSHNLQYPSASCGATIPVGGPQFGPSYIPLPSSPAANGGNDAACAAVPIAGRDFWGKTRPKGNHCTIGAAEADIQNIIEQGLAPIIKAVSTLFRCSCNP
jgi:hypothetical protein